MLLTDVEITVEIGVGAGFVERSPDNAGRVSSLLHEIKTKLLRRRMSGLMLDLITLKGRQ
jgi:hypothetical protein